MAEENKVEMKVKITEAQIKTAIRERFGLPKGAMIAMKLKRKSRGTDKFGDHNGFEYEFSHAEVTFYDDLDHVLAQKVKKPKKPRPR